MNRPSKRPAKKIVVPWGDHVLNGRNVGRTVGTPKLNSRIHASRAQQRREEYLKQQRTNPSHRHSHT